MRRYLDELAHWIAWRLDAWVTRNRDMSLSIMVREGLAEHLSHGYGASPTEHCQMTTMQGVCPKAGTERVTARSGAEVWLCAEHARWVQRDLAAVPPSSLPVA